MRSFLRGVRMEACGPSQPHVQGVATRPCIARAPHLGGKATRCECSTRARKRCRAKLPKQRKARQATCLRANPKGRLVWH